MPIAELIFVIIVGAIIFKVVTRKSSKKNDSEPELHLSNVEAGGMIHLKNIGPEMRSYDVQILSKNTYRQGNYEWYELEGDTGNEKVWLEYEDDDELEISITLQKLKLQDIGLSSADLKRIDDDEKGSLNYEGQTYYYEDSDNAEFLRHGKTEQAETFYYWDFEAEDEKHFIGVEKWGSNDYQASLSEAVKLSQIMVYSLKK